MRRSATLARRQVVDRAAPWRRPSGGIMFLSGGESMRRLRKVGPPRHRASLLIGILVVCVSSLGGLNALPASKEPPLPSLLVRPIGLLEGQGSLHRRVSTPSWEAQALYDQGLALLASYSWVDAARSFNQVLRSDPGLAVVKAELAQALRALGEVDEARTALLGAERAATEHRVDERDRRWVELAILQQQAIDAPVPEAEARTRAYRRAIEAYLRAYPRDPDGFVRRGDAASGPACQGQDGGEDSLRWYRAALSLAPDHLAAHHHLAHALEN